MKHLDYKSVINILLNFTDSLYEDNFIFKSGKILFKMDLEEKLKKKKILKSIENINLLKKELSNKNLKYLLI